MTKGRFKKVIRSRVGESRIVHRVTCNCLVIQNIANGLGSLTQTQTNKQTNDKQISNRQSRLCVLFSLQSGTLSKMIHPLWWPMCIMIHGAYAITRSQHRQHCRLFIQISIIRCPDNYSDAQWGKYLSNMEVFMIWMSTTEGAFKDIPAKYCVNSRNNLITWCWLFAGTCIIKRRTDILQVKVTNKFGKLKWKNQQIYFEWTVTCLAK